jgi:hypothetical protein
MDLFPDFKDLLAAFADSEVEYVLIGRDLEDASQLERIRSRQEKRHP